MNLKQTVNKGPTPAKILFLSSLGGILEFYDFVIYIIFSQMIALNFFPSSNKLSSLMSTYSVFAIGYLVRPLGGIIFSHFGDKYGRKTTFIVSVMLMAIPTFCIGLLPTYESIGIWASVCLVFLRILQGFSVGGEVPGALTFVSEHVPQKHLGLASGIIFGSLNIGTLLGSIVYIILLKFLSESQIISYGWRIPFLIGGIFGFFSFYIRREMTETQAFIRYQKEIHQSHIPLLSAIKHDWPKLLQGIGVTTAGAVAINLLFLYMPSYLATILGYTKQFSTLSSVIGLLIYTFLLIFFSFLGDRFGPKRFLFCGASGLLLLSYPLFSGLITHQTGAFIISSVFLIVFGSASMVFPSVLVNLYPSSIRYTGIALSYNIAFAIFGGLTGLISTILIQKTHQEIAPNYYLSFSALITVISLFSFVSIQKKTKVILR